MRKHFPSLVVIFVFSLVGLKALIHPGLFSAHDIWHQVARFYHYQKAVSDGQFPPYWIGTLANGFGYPLFFFSYHLPWILGLPILRVGLDIPTVLKTLFFISYLFSGIFMYLFANSLFKNRAAGLLVSIVYLWAPYRFLTILVSAAMGTAFLFVFLPLLFWGLWKISGKKTENNGTILVSVGLAGIILSHLMSLPSLIPLLLFFLGLTAYQNRKRIWGFSKTGLKAFFIGLGLASFYLLPAISYSRLTQVSTGVFKNLYTQNFPNLSQLIYSKWGYGIPHESIKESVFSLQIGIAQWLALLGILSILTVLIMRKKLEIAQKISKVFLDEKTEKYYGLLIVLIMGFVISIFLMLDASRPIWDFANRIITLDYPTMFMLPAVFAGSLLFGAVFLSFKKKIRPLVFTAVVIIAVYTNRNHLRVNMYTDFPVSLYVASETTTNSFHEYLPKTADIQIFGEENRLILPTNIEVIDFSQNTTTFSILASFPQDTYATIRHLSFPGINLYLDGQRKEINIDSLGRIKLNVPEGTHRIVVRFEETALIRVSKLITIASIFTLFFLMKNLYAKEKKT